MSSLPQSLQMPILAVTTHKQISKRVLLPEVLLDKEQVPITQQHNQLMSAIAQARAATIAQECLTHSQ